MTNPKPYRSDFGVQQMRAPSMAIDISWKEHVPLVLKPSHPTNSRIDLIARHHNSLVAITGKETQFEPERPTTPKGYEAIAYILILPGQAVISNNSIEQV